MPLMWNVTHFYKASYGQTNSEGITMGQRVKFNSLLKSVYYSDTALTEKDYIKSRRIIFMAAASASMILALTSGSFLAGFLTYLGASAQFCAIISVIPQFACFIQLISPMIFERLEHRKFLVCISCFIFRLSVSLVVFVPFLVKGTALRLTAILIIYTAGYLAAGFVTPGLNNWYLSVAPSKGRGRFLSIKDTIAMIVSAALTLGVGAMLDSTRNDGKPMTGFLIMYILAIALAFADFIINSFIKEQKLEVPQVKVSLRDSILTPLKDKKYIGVIIFFTVWIFASQFSFSFIPVYLVSELKLSYSFISTVGVLSSIAAMLALLIWGRVADAVSWTFLLRCCGLVQACCYLGWFFVDSSTSGILVPVLQIISACCSSAFGMGTVNLQFQKAPETGRTAYLGVCSAISCFAGFLSALLASGVSKLLQGLNFSIFRVSIGNIQILFLCTSILMFICITFILKRVND